MGEELAAGFIQIVEVMIVAQQDAIDWQKAIAGKCRSGGAGQNIGTGLVFCASRIEPRIGEKAQFCQFK